ncbi:sulfotransferase domain-containing protein [Salipiger bermudensis]|uniref:sulfotransferase domain-containing protein n=1 Tax=Salipiger bermudensis TaxID=344736 RepID=UPI0030090A6D
MTIYIHIGAQKTGSTTLQQAVFNNKEHLLKSGLLYPDVLPGDSNKVSHYNSVRGLFSENAAEVYETKQFFKSIEGFSGDILISAENLSNWPAVEADMYEAKKRAALQGLKELVGGANVKVIFCVRDRVEYLKSLFKQHLKVNKEVSRSVDQSLHRFLRRELVRSDFGKEAEMWRDAFGTVSIIDYDRYKRGGLIEAFCGEIGYGFSDSNVENKNISPNWAALEARRIGLSLGPVGVPLDADKEKAFNEDCERFVNSVILDAVNRA